LSLNFRFFNTIQANRLSPHLFFKSDVTKKELARKSVRGGITTIGSQVIRFFINIISTAVLARLLTPADYGLIGMVTVFINFTAMFKDAGLSMATVQKEEITHEQISTLFWFNFFISTVLGLSILFGSPIVALFYNKP